MKQQGVSFLHANISLAYFEAEKGFFLSILRLDKKYTMLIKKSVEGKEWCIHCFSPKMKYSIDSGIVC